MFKTIRHLWKLVSQDSSLPTLPDDGIQSKTDFSFLQLVLAFCFRVVFSFFYYIQVILQNFFIL